MTVSDTEGTWQGLNFGVSPQHHQDIKGATVCNLETWITMGTVRVGGDGFGHREYVAGAQLRCLSAAPPGHQGRDGLQLADLDHHGHGWGWRRRFRTQRVRGRGSTSVSLRSTTRTSRARRFATWRLGSPWARLGLEATVSDTEGTWQGLNFGVSPQHHYQDIKGATVCNLETWITMGTVRVGGDGFGHREYVAGAQLRCLSAAPPGHQGRDGLQLGDLDHHGHG